MTKALCGICLDETGRERVPEETDYCSKHTVTHGYQIFWRLYRANLNEIPDIEGMKEALVQALRVAAGLPREGV